MRVQKFQEFIVERDLTVINPGTMPSGVLIQIVDTAKKEKIITRAHGRTVHLPGWCDPLFPTRQGNYQGEVLDFKEFSFTDKGTKHVLSPPVLMRKNEGNLNWAAMAIDHSYKTTLDKVKTTEYILVSKVNDIDRKLVEEIFPDKLTLPFRNFSVVMSRSSVSSVFPADIATGIGSFRLKTYATRISYDIEVLDKSDTGGAGAISIENIKKMKSYGELMKSIPFVFSSTVKQVKNNTLVLKFPDDHTSGLPEAFKEGEFLKNYYIVYGKGDVRYITGASSPPIIKRFDPSSPEGWSSAFEAIEKHFREKVIPWLDKLDVGVYMTPEEKYRNRGSIKGRRFGI